VWRRCLPRCPALACRCLAAASPALLTACPSCSTTPSSSGIHLPLWPLAFNRSRLSWWIGGLRLLPPPSCFLACTMSCCLGGLLVVALGPCPGSCTSQHAMHAGPPASSPPHPPHPLLQGRQPFHCLSFHLWLSPRPRLPTLLLGLPSHVSCCMACPLPGSSIGPSRRPSLAPWLRSLLLCFACVPPSPRCPLPLMWLLRRLCRALVPLSSSLGQPAAPLPCLSCGYRLPLYRLLGCWGALPALPACCGGCRPSGSYSAGLCRYCAPHPPPLFLCLLPTLCGA